MLGGMDIAEAIGALDAAVASLAALDFDALSSAGRLEVLRGLETATRRQTSVGYDVLYSLHTHRTPGEFGGENPHQVVANALRITRGEVKKRFDTAEQLAPRASFTGEPLPPELPATSAGVRSGLLGDQHVQIIRSFLHHLPAAIDAGTREQAEAQLVRYAETLRPDDLRKVADRLAAHLNPDGRFDDVDRARKRGVWLGKQGVDGMSNLTGCVDPELRAYFEPIFEKLAAPGMCNLEDTSPVVDGEPDEDTARRDTRTVGQRQHDALKAVLRAMLASGDLGQHRGLPALVIVSTTLRELADMAGTGTTAGGSLLPVRDVLRMASHAFHYLVVFDVEGCVVHLGRSKRIASPDQRIVLHARDIGSTFPGCNMPGYRAETHHLREWADGGATDIDNLTFACPEHHKLVGPGEDQWRTHRGPDGRTIWTPPRHVDSRQHPRINRFHHANETLVAEGVSDGDPP